MTTTNTVSKTFGISGSTLKLLAIATMVLDHIGAAIVLPLLSSQPNYLNLYYVLRYVGRIAFPIFCFLLVEGFFHTKNVFHYGKRLLLFALISEVPFDLAIYQKTVSFQSQNVFFTLFIGLMTITLFSKSDTYFKDNFLLCFLVKSLSIIGGFSVALSAKTDYNMIGVAVILIFYILRNNRILAGFLGCLCLMGSSFMEFTAFLCIPFLKLYNGKRGLNLKYFFYLFYPVHLLLLYFIGRLF